MIYGEPETSRFLATVRRLKREQLRKVELTRLAKQRVRLILRKLGKGEWGGHSCPPTL